MSGFPRRRSFPVGFCYDKLYCSQLQPVFARLDFASLASQDSTDCERNIWQKIGLFRFRIVISRVPVDDFSPNFCTLVW